LDEATEIKKNFYPPLNMAFMRIHYLIFVFLLQFSAMRLQAQNVTIYKLPDLQKLLQRNTDTVYVINFWATWCRPCVEELPYFEQAKITFAQQKVRIILVSLDDRADLHTKLKPFLLRKQIKSKVVLLDETDYNSWINKIEPTWEGAIPATIIYNNSKKKRTFLERELSQNELISFIQNHL
jgi:thiol-disulfide isomerase/thioredoxin